MLDTSYSAHLTLGMLLHYLGKLESHIFLQIFSRFVRKCKRIFDISGVQNSESLPLLIRNKIFNVIVLLFYLFTFAINLWQWKFITADVTAVFANNQYGIQRRRQDFDKTFVGTQQRS